MRIKLLLTIMMAILLVTGCGKGDDLPEVKNSPDGGVVADPGRFTNFTKFPVITAEPDPDGVSLQSVGIAGEGAYIMVAFSASQNQSSLWMQDYIYVVDEETMGVYKDIPVMPVVGPLLGKPSKEGQVGYVMLMNYYQAIKDGSKVTVVLGNYKREHVIVGYNFDSSNIPDLK